MTESKAPMGLKLGGKRLWRRVMSDFELAQHEEVVLLQACRIVDVLDRLQKVIEEGDVVVHSPQGVKTNPAVVEFRQQAMALAKCMAALNIPADSEQPAAQFPERYSKLAATK